MYRCVNNWKKKVCIYDIDRVNCTRDRATQTSVKKSKVVFLYYCPGCLANAIEMGQASG